jgi:hypothetical protein
VTCRTRKFLGPRICAHTEIKYFKWRVSEGWGPALSVALYASQGVSEFLWWNYSLHPNTTNEFQWYLWECIQKFPDLPPGARTANGTALCHWVQLYRYFMSQSSKFCRHNPMCCFSTSFCCCLFRYRLSPETFGYALVHTAKCTNAASLLCLFLPQLVFLLAMELLLLLCHVWETSAMTRVEGHVLFLLLLFPYTVLYYISYPLSIRVTLHPVREVWPKIKKVRDLRFTRRRTFESRTSGLWRRVVLGEYGGGKVPRNVGIPPQHYTASQPKRPRLKQSPFK